MPIKKSKLPYSFSQKDLQITAKKELFSRFFKISLITFKHRLFAGGWSQEVQRELFQRGDAVVVLPFDPVADKIIMLEQIRIGCIENANHPWSFEFVGGMIEPGESIQAVAERETLEETGMQLQAMIPVQSYLTSCGGTSERIHVFIGRVNADEASEICGLPEEHEDIRVHAFDSQMVMQWLDEGLIENASPLIALQWLKLNFVKVRQQWREKSE
ncbi:ADP-ribose diphosphatase [Gayadomonas joobiniege]|uniref:ADP-ribose diphosphatase n=1 Tax=Gayadomonas joobiniege TaxID=1234606 RepID=UPI00037F2F00|nr:ADP-ribose diphosphatase [Gayadomonas joobiniege]